MPRRRAFSSANAPLTPTPPHADAVAGSRSRINSEAWTSGRGGDKIRLMGERTELPDANLNISPIPLGEVGRHTRSTGSAVESGEISWVMVATCVTSIDVSSVTEFDARRDGPCGIRIAQVPPCWLQSDEHADPRSVRRFSRSLSVRLQQRLADDSKHPNSILSTHHRGEWHSGLWRGRGRHRQGPEFLDRQRRHRAADGDGNHRASPVHAELDERADSSGGLAERDAAVRGRGRQCLTTAP